MSAGSQFDFRTCVVAVRLKEMDDFSPVAELVRCAQLILKPATL